VKGKSADWPILSRTPSPSLSRRVLLANVGVGAAVTLLAACSSGGSSTTAPPTSAPAAASQASAAPTAASSAATAPKPTAPASAPPTAQPAAAVSAKSSAPVTINYWFLGGKLWEDFYTKDIYPKFYQQYPNVKIEDTVLGGWTDLYNKLVTSAAGGSPPELAREKDFFTPDWAVRGIVQPLDDYVKTAPQLTADQYMPKPWQNCFYSGKMVATPLHIFIHYLHYNPGIFQKAGVSAAPNNWQEFQDVAKKTTDAANGVWGTMLRDYGGQEDTVNFFHVWLTMAGGQFIDGNNQNFLFNSPQGREALNFQVNLIKDKSMLPPGAPNTHVIENNKIGMWFSAANYWPGYLDVNPNLKWLLAHNPMNKTRGAVIRGNHLVIFKGAPQKESAWNFMAFHATPDIDYLYGQVANYVTARLDNHNRPYYKGLYKNMPGVDWHFEFDALNDPGDENQPIFPGYQECTFKIGAQLMQAYMLKKKPEDALTQAEADAKDTLSMLQGYLGTTPKK